MNEITQTNFSLPVMIPSTASDHAVLRVRYISQNPTENDRGMTFYQCADIKVTAGSSVAPFRPTSTATDNSKKQEQPVVSKSSYECCAPKQFTLEGFETSSWRNPTNKAYYFDTDSKFFRVDTNSGSGMTPKDGHFQMFSNFSNGIEYYYNVAANTCDLYGLNYWSDWCYGSVNNQVHLTQVKVGHETADVWAMPGNNDVFTWTNTRVDCLPVGFTRVDSGELTVFYNFKEGAPDASFFQLPSACIRKEEEMLKSGKKLPQSTRHHMKM
jgi:hypothetical protein